MPHELITVARAREIVLDSAGLLQTESVRIGDALDRVLARDLRAADDVPAFPSSAMDGYAVEEGPPGRTLKVVGESRAGVPYDGVVEDHQAVRISTGAAVPAGASAVIRQEDTEEQAGTVTIRARARSGENVRAAGEVMRRGNVVLGAGSALGAAELGAAVAAGAGEVTVTRSPRVQVLCTGDELRAPGERLGPGEIHNSNAPMLISLASRLGAIAPPEERLPDDRAATERGLKAALERSDVLIVSGGVSVGPHDHVKDALGALEVEELFWGVALQPGRPTWFGTIDQRLVFGLPGNPVSAAVTFTLFARPAILALQGRPQGRAFQNAAALGAAVRRNTRREQALRVRLEHRDGAVVAIPNGPQGSHVVTSLVGADALALIPRGEGELAAGDRVELEPFQD